MSILHEFRINEKGRTATKELTPLRAIRKHCLECVGFSAAEVKLCTSKYCALFPFRLGRSGNKGKGRSGNTDALRKFREAR